MKFLNTLVLILLIIGALNWGLVGFFQIDVITGLFSFAASRVIFAIVGLAGLYAFTFFRKVCCCHKDHSCCRDPHHKK